MFFPPSFEPHTLIEPQWFPRPITDSQESQLDLLERLEEDRKRRLRNIVNVPSKTPVGLCTGSDAASLVATGGTTSAAVDGSNRFTSDGNANRANRSNAYTQYRYYPPQPPTSTSSNQHHQHNPIATTQSYITNTPYASFLHNHTNQPQLLGQNTSLTSADVGTSMVQERHLTHAESGLQLSLSHISHSHISHDISHISHDMSNNMYQSSFYGVTSPQFHSPLLDPRGGTARRISGVESGGVRQMTGHQYQMRRQQVQQQRQADSGNDQAALQVSDRTSYDDDLGINMNSARFRARVSNAARFAETSTTRPSELDYRTPEEQGIVTTPGHGHSGDVYSQRRLQRRRRGE